MRIYTCKLYLLEIWGIHTDESSYRTRLPCHKEHGTNSRRLILLPPQSLLLLLMPFVQIAVVMPSKGNKVSGHPQQALPLLPHTARWSGGCTLSRPTLNRCQLVWYAVGSPWLAFPTRRQQPAINHLSRVSLMRMRLHGDHDCMRANRMQPGGQAAVHCPGRP